jgi:hypothetical protein
MSITLVALDIHLHQINQIGSACDEFRVRVCRDLAERIGDVAGAHVMKTDHDPSIACWMAATIFV